MVLQKTQSKLKKSTDESSKGNSTKNPPSINSGQAMTMEKLLQSTGYNIPILKRGQDITGKIISASRSEILVDIGAKSEGIIYSREIAAAGDLLADISVGDPLEATVIYPENDAGQVVLSLRKLSGVKRWNDLLEKKESGEPVEVTVIEINRGGVICEYFGLRGFLPVSHLLHNLKGDLVGKRLPVQILEADKNTARLIFSQKPPEVKNLDEIVKLLDKVEIGEKYTGVVSAILPFGVFVEIGVKSTTSGQSTTSITGSDEKASDTSDTLDARDTLKTGEASKLEGLVHVSEISWEKVDDSLKGYAVGQKLEVIVIAKDLESGRLNLSIKQLGEDPFLKMSEKYSKDQKVSGKVSKVTPFGVFVELEQGVEGLIHISKIPPNITYDAGKKIECEIESIDTAAHRISLVPIATEKPILYR